MRLIPETHNCPGFPEGIGGTDLQRRLTTQAEAFGARIIAGRVESLGRAAGAFVLGTSCGTISASHVILATGIVDKAPPMSGLEDAVSAGTVRLCPVCDAFEAKGRLIGVVGPDHLALREASYLRDFSPHVALLFNDADEVSGVVRQEAAAAGIEIWDDVDDLVRREGGFDVVTTHGAAPRRIDLLYPAMGCDVRSELAGGLGARLDDDGYVLVGQHLETSVPGLYAIGDVAKALNQISVGFGHAALAAGHIHNGLRAATAPQQARLP